MVYTTSAIGRITSTAGMARERNAMGKPRFEVCIHGRLSEADRFGSVDITHRFTSRIAAEKFAREISRYLPAHRTQEDLVLAWVLVYALASSPKTSRSSLCYLCFDPGAIVVKRHAIPDGFYGHRRASEYALHAGDVP